MASIKCQGQPPTFPYSARIEPLRHGEFHTCNQPMNRPDRHIVLKLLLAVMLVFSPLRVVTAMPDMDCEKTGSVPGFAMPDHDCCDPGGGSACGQACEGCAIGSFSVPCNPGMARLVGPLLPYAPPFDERLTTRNPAPLLRPPADLHS